MSPLSCLYGPDFDLIGEIYLSNNSFSFAVGFNTPADQQSVLAYQWFLDQVVLIDEDAQQVNSKADNGPHIIGVRILTTEGWSGIRHLDFYANIMPSSLSIQGPTQLQEGANATYETYLSFGNTPPIRVTDKTSFKIDIGGVFDFNLLSVSRDDDDFNDKNATITATLAGGMSKTLTLTILNTSVPYPSVLVVDIYDDSSLNAGAIIVNADINGGQALVYTGNNFLPNNVPPADALIIVSDPVNNASILKWRLQFNIGRLIKQYPRLKDFVLEIRGRSNAAKAITGAFGLKDHTGVMAMNGSAGSYLPTVIGGSNVYYGDFQTHALAGANGNYNKDYLPMLISFNFNVPTSILTYYTADQIVIQDFDFMALRYQWAPGAGADLDILVGFENSGTPYDNVYVGWGGAAGRTVPPNTMPQTDSYLWWASDNTGASGIEGVLIDLEKFTTAFPGAANTIDIGLYAAWFGQPITGNFSIALVTYKGGSMSLEGTDFVNTGGYLVNSEQIMAHTMIRKTGGATANSYKVGKLSYNKVTKTAVLYTNP